MAPVIDATVYYLAIKHRSTLQLDKEWTLNCEASGNVHVHGTAFNIVTRQPLNFPVTQRSTTEIYRVGQIK